MLTPLPTPDDIFARRRATGDGLVACRAALIKHWRAENLDALHKRLNKELWEDDPIILILRDIVTILKES